MSSGSHQAPAAKASEGFEKLVLAWEAGPRQGQLPGN